MKVAVIGRGSAGSLAAASISWRFPDFELTHIYNSKVPVIGVGEGTLPSLPQMLSSISGLPEEAVRGRLEATRKFGIQFEGWGNRNEQFFEHFYPRHETYGYHLSADLLVDLLAERIQGRCLDANVVRLTSHGTEAEIELEGGDVHTFDLVFDARGFPRELDPAEHIDVSFIPTNSAMIRRAPALTPREYGEATRSVARPHGWIFVIPLRIHTSYGYIFNRDISTAEQVAEDFDQFLDEEGWRDFEHRAVISFPNFISRNVYDGAVARIGNAGGFMEPLEATALSLIERQLAVILAKRFSRPKELIEKDAEAMNRHLIHWAWKFGIFIASHYAKGSIYETDFWRFARHEAWPRSFAERQEPGLDVAAQTALFKRFLDAGVRFARGEDVAMKPPLFYSGFPVEYFADMSGGLGWQDSDLPLSPVSEP